PGAVTVRAEDQFGNVDNSGPNAFNGTVTITSSDNQATLPSPAALSNGTGSFNVTLKTAGTQSITAASGSITGSQSNITVNPAAATQFVVSRFPNPVIAGTPGAVTVRAEDQFGNVDNSGPNAFNGTVTITSSDNQATTVAQGFASPLVVLVKDTYGNPVPGASVTFAAPPSGASATLSSSTAT